MALFKILRGNKSNLPPPQHDGWAYFTTDSHEFFIDYKDNAGELQRASITPRLIPRLSEDGVYYFETLTPSITPTPIPPSSVLYINCGNSQNFVADITYAAGDSSNSDSAITLQAI